ncbi:MAG: 2-dehydro-3-deoxyphosphogluconate aldolase, partial [Mycetocola sp.]
PDVPLMPTGGVSPENIGEWFAAGAIAVGAGSDLVASSALAAEDWAEITRRAELFSASGVSA